GYYSLRLQETNDICRRSLVLFERFIHQILRATTVLLVLGSFVRRGGSRRSSSTAQSSASTQEDGDSYEGKCFLHAILGGSLRRLASVTFHRLESVTILGFQIRIDLGSPSIAVVEFALDIAEVLGTRPCTQLTLQIKTNRPCMFTEVLPLAPLAVLSPAN